MKIQHPTIHPFFLSRPIVPCAQCGETLFAAEWSEYLDDCNIRHLWSCDDCGYRFETLVRYPQLKRSQP